MNSNINHQVYFSEKTMTVKKMTISILQNSFARRKVSPTKSVNFGLKRAFLCDKVNKLFRITCPTNNWVQ